MSPKNPPTVILGVTGSIAAYKAADVARRLQDAGYTVQPVLSTSAREFIGALTFEAITGKKVPRSELWMTRGSKIGHIELLKHASAVIVAPATANIIAKHANGIADDLLSTVLAAAACPVVIAPAMNPDMYLSKVCQENLSRLKARGIVIVEPVHGPLACGDEGVGKLSDTKDIVRAVKDALASSTELSGVRAVVTVGGTVEHIDPVRVITNLSSGRTGMEIAAELLRRGASVTVIAGRTDVAAPTRAKVVSALSAQAMLEQCKKAAAVSDVLIMAAAVSDLTPAVRAASKIKKSSLGETFSLELRKNPDILTELGLLKKRGLLVGFAAETSDHIAAAKSKLVEKNADLFVANLVGRNDSDFGLATTTAAIIASQGRVRDLGNTTKEQLAVVLCDEIRKALKKRSGGR